MSVADAPKKSRNKKVAAGIGVAAIAAAAIAIGSGTYAAFTDTEAGPGGTFAAGTLSLEVGGTGATELFSASNIKPGFTSNKQISIKNAGTVDGTLTATATSGTNALAQQILVSGSCSIAGGQSFPVPSTPIAQIGTNIVGAPAIPLAAGKSIDCNLTFLFKNDDAVNNAAQGQSATLTSNFTLKS